MCAFHVTDFFVKSVRATRSDDIHSVRRKEKVVKPNIRIRIRIRIRYLRIYKCSNWNVLICRNRKEKNKNALSRLDAESKQRFEVIGYTS